MGVYSSSDGTAFERLVSVPSYDIFNDSSVILLACEDGVYQASYEQCVEDTGEGDTVAFRYFLRKKNANAMSGVRTVCFNPVSYTVFAGTISGILYATLSKEPAAADMQFAAADLYEGDSMLSSLRVNDIITLDHSANPQLDASNDTVAATEKGVFQSIQAGAVGNKVVRLQGKNCRCQADFFGRRYVGTDAGVYAVDDETRAQDLSGVIYSAEQKPEYAFYGGKGGIWKVDGQGQTSWIDVEADQPVDWMRSCYLTNDAGETVDALVMRSGTGNVYVYDVENACVTDVAEISGDCIAVQNGKAYYASDGVLNVCGIAFGETYSATKMESVAPYLTYGSVSPDIVDMQRSVGGNDLLVQTTLVSERDSEGAAIRQCGCQNVTLFKTLNYEHSGYRYGMIDAGGLYLMTADFKRSNRVAPATQFSDTENMIVFSNGGSLSVRRDSGEVVVARSGLESSVVAVEGGASGAFLLFDSGKIAYYAETRIVQKSGMMQGDDLRSVTAVDDHDAVLVSTPEKLAVYVKKSGTGETSEFYQAAIPGASNSAFARGNTIYDCGPAGISAYGVTWSEPPVVSSSPSEILFPGEDVRAGVSADGVLYVATETGLSSVSDGFIRRGEIIHDFASDAITTFRGEDGSVVHVAADESGLSVFNDGESFGSVAVGGLNDMAVQESEGFEFDVYAASDSGLVAATVTVLSGDIPSVGPARTLDPNMHVAVSHSPSRLGMYSTDTRAVYAFDSSGVSALTDTDGMQLQFGHVDSLAAVEGGVLVVDDGVLNLLRVSSGAKCSLSVLDNIEGVREVRVAGDSAVFLKSELAYAVPVSEISP